MPEERACWDPISVARRNQKKLYERSGVMLNSLFCRSVKLVKLLCVNCQDDHLSGKPVKCRGI